MHGRAVVNPTVHVKGSLAGTTGSQPVSSSNTREQQLRLVRAPEAAGAYVCHGALLARLDQHVQVPVAQPVAARRLLLAGVAIPDVIVALQASQVRPGAPSTVDARHALTHTAPPPPRCQVCTCRMS
jgi:hypothetical protein